MSGEPNETALSAAGGAPEPGPLIDVEAARFKVGLDRQDYLTLCEILLEEQAAIVDGLQRARGAGPHAVAKVLHELANSIAVLGVAPVAAQLRERELALRGQPSVGAEQEAVDFALQVFARIVGEIRAII